MKKVRFLVFALSFFLFMPIFSSGQMYICTSCDSDFYNYLINLIDSIHYHDFERVGEIAVFDLGLTAQQVNELKTIQKVNVYDIEMTNPDLLTHFRTSNYGRKVRGLFSWKPVAMKQGLDKFLYILYMDAGLMTLGSLDPIFEQIQTDGYFFMGCGHSIRWMCPEHVTKTFNLSSDTRQWILDDNVEGISGGFMGLTIKEAQNFLLPIYDLAHDIKHFVDDGTTPGGFGTGRHDQVLFSIQAKLLGMQFDSWHNQDRLVIDGKRVPCLYRDIVIRTHNVKSKNIACRNGGIEIRKHIKYK